LRHCLFIVSNLLFREVIFESVSDAWRKKNRRWAENAPVLMLAVAMENFNHNGRPNRWATYGQHQLMLAGYCVGNVGASDGGFDAEQAREVFKLPGDCRPRRMRLMI
jgi:hypothetical protein